MAEFSTRSDFELGGVLLRLDSRQLAIRWEYRLTREVLDQSPRRGGDTSQDIVAVCRDVGLRALEALERGGFTHEEAVVSFRAVEPRLNFAIQRVLYGEPYLRGFDTIRAGHDLRIREQIRQHDEFLRIREFDELMCGQPYRSYRFHAQKTRITGKPMSKPRRCCYEQAEALLLRHLTPEQQRNWQRENAFEVQTPRGVFVISKGWTHNILERTTGNIYCAGPEEVLPIADFVLAQKLALEADTETFLRGARRREHNFIANTIYNDTNNITSVRTSRAVNFIPFIPIEEDRFEMLSSITGTST